MRRRLSARPLSDRAAGGVAGHSLMTSAGAPSAEAERYWKGPREMPQEAHAGEKKRKLWRDHQAIKATAKKVVILGRTFDLLYITVNDL